MDRRPIRRHAFRGVAWTQRGRYAGAFTLVLSLFLAATAWSIVLSPIFVLFALGGLYRLLRPAKPGWYVELQEDVILVNKLTTNTIRYRDIRNAGFFVYRLRGFTRTLANASNALGRLFGGTSPIFGKFGEVDRERIQLRLRRWRWFYVPFPPFLFPSRGVLLWVEDASGLLAELQARLPGGPSDRST